jgi:hypothetical protein
MERKTGYYWVRTGKGWEVSKWDSSEKCWYLTGANFRYFNRELLDIDENMIIRKNIDEEPIG